MEKNKLSLILGITLMISSCYHEKIVSSNEVIKQLTASPDKIPADGVSKTRITLELNPDVTDQKRFVTFTSTKGLFEIENKNTITVNAVDTVISGIRKVIAYTSLLSINEDGVGIITGKSQNFSRSINVNFETAYPDYLQVWVDKLNYKVELNAELIITVQLKRNAGGGKPSTGQQISLSVTDKSGKAVGQFRNKNLVTDQEGKCVTYFSINPGDSYTGPVKITASSLKNTTESISESILVNLL